MIKLCIISKQSTVYFVQRIPKEALSCILTKWKLLTNNTGEKLVRLHLPNSFIFVKFGQNNKDHTIRKIMLFKQLSLSYEYSNYFQIFAPGMSLFQKMPVIWWWGLTDEPPISRKVLRCYINRTENTEYCLESC